MEKWVVLPCSTHQNGFETGKNKVISKVLPCFTHPKFKQWEVEICWPKIWGHGFLSASKKVRSPMVSYPTGCSQKIPKGHHWFYSGIIGDFSITKGPMLWSSNHGKPAHVLPGAYTDDYWWLVVSIIPHFPIRFGEDPNWHGWSTFPEFRFWQVIWKGQFWLSWCEKEEKLKAPKVFLFGSLRGWKTNKC